MPEDRLPEYPGPGILYVPTQPKASSVAGFHHWYNTEHGPARVGLDFFCNGYRYKARDTEPALWLACYDLTRVSGMAEKQYTTLRAKRSSQENQVLGHEMNFVDRRIYTTISSRGRDKSPAPVILAVRMWVQNDHAAEVDRWYEEEHVEALSKIPGWIRTRRFRLVAGPDEKPGITEMIALHEFEKVNGLGGPEHVYARSTPWRNKIINEVVEDNDKTTWDFYHEFAAEDYRNPEPTDGVNGVKKVSLPSGPTSWPLDGYLHIWDSAITLLKIEFPGYRFLRYNTRGYESNSHFKVNIDVLADDIARLLD